METALFGLFALSVLFNALNCRELGINSIVLIFIKGVAQLIFIQVIISFFSSVALSPFM